MSRTRRAALQAFAVAFVLVAGTTVFLGGSLLVGIVAGLVLGVLGAALVLGAAGRAGYGSDDQPRSPADGSTPPGASPGTPAPTDPTAGVVPPPVDPAEPPGTDPVTPPAPTGNTPDDHLTSDDDEDDDRG